MVVVVLCTCLRGGGAPPGYCLVAPRAGGVGVGGAVGALASPPPPHQYTFASGRKNEVYYRGPKFDAEFGYTNLFFAS